MSDLMAQNHANTMHLVAEAIDAPTPEQRAALVAEFEKHADWHDDNVFAGRYWIPVETAADVAIDAGWKP